MTLKVFKQLRFFHIYFVKQIRTSFSENFLQDVTDTPPISISYREKRQRWQSIDMNNNMKEKKTWYMKHVERKMRTNSDFFAISVCWRFCPFSRQLHANDFPITSQEFPQINWIQGALKQTKWPQLGHTVAARPTRSDRNIMQYRTNGAL